MRKALAISLILLNIVFLTSCSYSVNFVVINESDHPVEIEYTFIFNLDTLEDSGLQPHRMSSSDWNAWFGNKDKKWIKLQQNSYKFDSENSKCKVTLAPNDVLRILSTNDAMYFVEDYQNFEITNIKLTGKNGVIEFSGKQIFKQFDEKNFTNRFITYE